VEKPFPAKVDRKLLRCQLSDDPGMAGASNHLREGEIKSCEPLPRGSNYVFLLSLARNGKNTVAIYKPRRGEAPLYDFPEGTLYQREVAAYLVSQALGWFIVPPTIVRLGPHGVGAVQWFVRVKPGTSYHTLAERYPSELRRLATFDWLVNNADRKAGHCLQGEDGRIWGIDHGLTFHVVPKLRTVIWDFSGQPVPGQLIADLQQLGKKLIKGGALTNTLSQLLDDEEVEALRERLSTILKRPVFPPWSGSYHSVPWPPF
jgi:hypothetical protein